MHGLVALVGAGEFTPAMREVDLGLLRATGTLRPLVAIVPTAAFPDGEETFLRWAAMGVGHFSGLGADAEAVLIRDRIGAADPGLVRVLARADLIYFSGGKPAHLLDVLDDSPAWQATQAAHARGAVLAGCSAGAMVLGGCQLGARRGKVPVPPRWQAALGVVPGIAVIPHYDRFPEPLAALVALGAPGETRVLGIDEDTALVGRDGRWQVQGRGRVTVWRGSRRTRHRAGDVLRL